MNNELLPLLSGSILEEETDLTLDELCRVCHVHTSLVIELVEEGVLEPRGKEPSSWVFTGISIKRTRAVLRLQSDLGVNLPGAALALQLLDELEQLRTRLRIIESGGQ
jgi:chaperone modulatory protein CbpM